MDDIATSRLIISELSNADAPFILELLNSPGWLKYIGDRNVITIEDACNYIIKGPVKSYEKNGFGLCMVKLKIENIAVGICGLIKRDSLNDIDIGFAFLPAYNGKGYAFESSTAILASAKKLYGVKRIVAITTADNLKSISLLKKLGMHFEKNITLPRETEELKLFSIDF